MLTSSEKEHKPKKSTRHIYEPWKTYFSIHFIHSLDVRTCLFCIWGLMYDQNYKLDAERWYLLCHVTGFDVNELSEDANDDVHGLEASASYVASLLANEPADSEFSTLVDIQSLICNSIIYNINSLVTHKYVLQHRRILYF